MVFWKSTNTNAVNGRLAAAEKVVTDLNVESLSLSRTEALCGYPFDFMHPGSEEQDERQLHAFRESITGAARSSLPHLSTLPDADGHHEIVLRLREHSAAYFDLQQIVRLLVMFREWREEEDKLIKLVTLVCFEICANRSRIRGTAKVNTKRIKELLDTIQAVFDTLIPSLEDSQGKDTSDMVNLKRAYVPEIIIAYLSVLQSASFFLSRESAVKAMEVATLVADEDNAWLQEVFLQTGRMSELVDTLAQVSKAMLKLNEHEGKKKETKKRGSKGETLRIWDLNAMDRL
jgi:nuclear pore complex protein Nup107